MFVDVDLWVAYSTLPRPVFIGPCGLCQCPFLATSVRPRVNRTDRSAASGPHRGAGLRPVRGLAPTPYCAPCFVWSKRHCSTLQLAPIPLAACLAFLHARGLPFGGFGHAVALARVCARCVAAGTPCCCGTCSRSSSARWCSGDIPRVIGSRARIEGSDGPDQEGGCVAAERRWKASSNDLLIKRTNNLPLSIYPPEITKSKSKS